MYHAPLASLCCLLLAVIWQAGIMVAQVAGAPSEDGWWGIAKSVPALAVLVGLVIGFLRALEKKDARHAADQKQLTERVSDSLDRNTAAIDKNNEMHGRVMTALDRRKD